MKKKILLGACFMAVFSLASAQDELQVTDMGGGGFTIGYGYMDVDPLHEFLPPSAGTFDNNQLLLGGTGHGFIGRLVLGGGGFGMTGSTFVGDSLRGSVSGGAGTFDVGYVVVNRTQLKLFPMIGIGGGGYGVSITETSNLSVSQVTQDPGRSINISNGGILADVSINLYTIPALQYDLVSNSYGGFMIGLKIGYLYSVPSSSWSYAGGDISGGPKFGFNMPYAKLVLGGFGFSTL